MVAPKTYSEDARASGAICEKLTALLESLGDVTEEQVLVAMVERTAMTAASFDGVSENDARQMLAELAMVLMRDCRKALHFYRSKAAGG